MSQILYDYTQQDASGSSCVAHAWAKVREPLAPDQRRQWKARAAALLKQHGAVLVAHYYVDGDLQDLALETGGCVADSLEMARFGRDHAAKTLVVAGVRFMGESAKILSPDKRVLMPDLDATCSLDLGCPPDEFAAFCDAHPDRTVVVYANTSAAVKARADWVATSGMALELIEHLSGEGQKILWAPDKHLGDYVTKKSGGDVLIESALYSPDFLLLLLEPAVSLLSATRCVRSCSAHRRIRWSPDPSSILLDGGTRRLRAQEYPVGTSG